MLKKRNWYLMLIVVGAILLLVGVASAAPAVDCSSTFASNTFINSCDAVNALNSYSSPFDAWGIYQRTTAGVDAGQPIDCFDETVTGTPQDEIGIIKSGYTEEFFCIADTNNDDTAGADQTLVLDFDISGAGSVFLLSVDLAAMGDFEEGSDTVTFAYEIDGGGSTSVILLDGDNAGTQNYTMESGTVIPLADPMVATFGSGGSCAVSNTLNNNLQTCTANISGSGNSLVLTITANTNGAGEAIVFDHIVISGETSNPTSVTLSTLSATGFNPSMLALALAAILAISAGAFVLRRRAVL